MNDLTFDEEYWVLPCESVFFYGPFGGYDCMARVARKLGLNENAAVLAVAKDELSFNGRLVILRLTAAGENTEYHIFADASDANAFADSYVEDKYVREIFPLRTVVR